MVDVLLLNRLRALAEHRRWLIGSIASARCRSMTAALVAASGSGLAARLEVVAHRRAPLPNEVSLAYRRLCRRSPPGSAAAAALLAARMAECHAALLDEFASEVAAVWERISAIAVAGAGFFRRAGGLAGYLDLCDAARLAELTGLNVVHDFPARDLAQDGRGGPLLPLAYWMLLRDPYRTTALVQIGRRARLTLLPAGAEAAGAARVASMVIDAAHPPEGAARPPARAPLSPEELASRIVERTAAWPRIDEWVLGGRAGDADFAARLSAALGGTPVRQTSALRVDPLALRAGATAALGLMHLDQVPANVPAITGARTPRVLGSLTPGSVVNWHRLLRELAARRPNAVSLRSAV